MPCDLQRDKDGQVTKIICSRGPRKCRWCSSSGTQLCDFPVNGKTCDAPMCLKHTRRVSYEVDYCPDHAPHTEG